MLIRLLPALVFNTLLWHFIFSYLKNSKQVDLLNLIEKIMKQKLSGNIISTYISLFKDAFAELGKNDPLRMAGATAFFTTFALPPILLILTQVLGLLYKGEVVNQQLFIKLTETIGRRSVQQIIEVLNGFRVMAKNWLITIGGFIFLLFVATTLFKIIKSSLNQILKIRIVEKRSLWYKLRNRIKAIAVILVAGLLFIIGLVSESMQAILGDYIGELSPILGSLFKSTINYFLSLVIVTLWFAILFQYLPDCRHEWKVVIVGGFITSLLFNIGKLIIRWLLLKSNINTIYGASGSIVLLLLFVFYSSLILYYGAAVTKTWGLYHNKKSMPLSHAVHYHLEEEKE